jgi:HEAT repeat protein
MSFPARADLCVDGGDGIWHQRFDSNWSRPCEDGPVRVQAWKDGPRITALRTYVGGAWRASVDATDLGDVSADAASDWLLDLAATAAPSVGADAIDPAVMADVPDPWVALLDLGRDHDLAEDVRERAIFWVGQSAAREATRRLAELAENETETTRIQQAAVFALSQRDESERIDHLLRVARTHPNPEVVRSAFFWLAESSDERAIQFFEEVLLRPQ